MEETIIALSTAYGRAALGVVRMSGGMCKGLAENVFNRGEVVPKRMEVGWYRKMDGQRLDQVTFVYFEKGGSYTGEEMLEVTCHGNPLIINGIIADCVARGCRVAEPGEFTRRAFLNGMMDLCQAEGVADVIHAQSEAALGAAERQLQGALGEQFARISDHLLNVVAQVEANIDFPEDDTALSNTVGEAVRAVIGDIERLVETQHRHRCLQEGLRVVIVGAPNAGKSSLLNALLGEERAIVSEEAGTTRDFISETLRLEPFVLRLTDTAGLREGKNSIEQSGIAKTLQQMRSADCLLLVVDASAEMPEFSEEVSKLLAREKTFVVYNKVDLVKDENLIIEKTSKPFFGERSGEPIFAKNGSPGIFHPPLVSAKTGEGMDVLKAALRAFLMERYWGSGGDSDVMVNVRHVGHLEGARGFLVEALEGMTEKHRPIELVASDLRGALNEIDGITGTVGTEAILDRIFQQFCIGK